MPSNDKSKTSKTARVMNLLSKKSAAAGPAPEQPAGEVGEAVPEEAKPAPRTPPILNTIGADAAASDQIRNALEDALAEEMAPPAPEPVAAAQPIPEPAPEPEPEPVQLESVPAAPAPAEPQPAPEVPQPAPVVPQPVPVVPQPAAVVPQPAPVSFQQPVPADVGYINVMQVLVEEKAPKYVKMFGLCDCKRCLEDVKALALNHLPPKYVVIDQGDRVPKLTFYEGKYNSDVTAQLLKACSKVSERPHHTRT